MWLWLDAAPRMARWATTVQPTTVQPATAIDRVDRREGDRDVSALQPMKAHRCPAHRALAICRMPDCSLSLHAASVDTAAFRIASNRLFLKEPSSCLVLPFPSHATS
ncbi:MAG: hypothetical protein AAF772_02825 [Acidobacteriota bacterium]